MTGVSLRVGGREHLALPGGVAHLRAGGTGGLPLLAPWANRLAARRYYARQGCPSTCAGSRWQPTDGACRSTASWRAWRAGTSTGPIPPRSAPPPGPRWTSTIRRSRSRTASTSRSPQSGRSWSSPRPSRPPGTAGYRAFGWHPYLRLTGVPRRQWLLRLPARRHVALDGSGIPTGDEVGEPAEAAPIGRRTFDDLYTLGSDRSVALQTTDGRSIELRNDAAYPYAQVGCPLASRTPRSSRWLRRRTRSWPARRRRSSPASPERPGSPCGSVSRCAAPR